MCGRYAASRSPEDLAEEFEVDRVDWGSVRERLVPDWNVAPTKDVPAVLTRWRRDDEGRRTDEPERRLAVLRWGLVPSWAKDASIGSRLINARVESVHDKPAFRKAFASRRCLLPADGYYEWYGEQKGRKQPFFIGPRGGGGIAMAGLYELWRDPQAGPDAPLVWTCTVLTTSATDSLGRIHDRMPLLVERPGWTAWLDPATADPQALRDLLVPAAPGLLDAHPVSPAVGNVEHNGPELVVPLPVEADAAMAAVDAADAGDARLF